MNKWSHNEEKGKYDVDNKEKGLLCIATPWAGHSLTCGMVAAVWDCPLDPWKLTQYIPSLNGEGPSQQVW